MTDVPRRRAALITGAASGIGRATAELFAERGWWIGAADRNLDGLHALQSKLGYERCAVWQLDVTDIDAYRSVVAEVGRHTGGQLDLLYNNAGIAAGGFFDEVPIEEHLRVIDVNLIGVLNGIYSALPLLKATPNSLCFSTSSAAATYGSPGLASYAATKFAVKGMTEALAVEFSRFGVRVADVLPGVVDTAIFTESPVYVGGERISTADLPTAAETAPPDGPSRLVPPSMVADAVWACYDGDDRMHWYVPDEVEQIDKAKAVSPETIRDERIERQRSMLG